jgi:hypothetical protein
MQKALQLPQTARFLSQMKKLKRPGSLGKARCPSDCRAILILMLSDIKKALNL